MHAFVANDPIERVDVVGLYTWDPETKTITVGPCEITLYLGHAQGTLPFTWKFTSECAGGGAFTCYPLSNNPSRKDSQSLWDFYSPSWLPDNGLCYCGSNLPDQPVYGGHNIFVNVYKSFFGAAYEKAIALCKNKCCGKIGINSIVQNGALGRHDGGSTNPLAFVDFNYLVDCANQDRAAFDRYVDQWFEAFKKNDKKVRRL